MNQQKLSICARSASGSPRRPRRTMEPSRTPLVACSSSSSLLACTGATRTRFRSRLLVAHRLSRPRSSYRSRVLAPVVQMSGTNVATCAPVLALVQVTGGNPSADATVSGHAPVADSVPASGPRARGSGALLAGASCVGASHLCTGMAMADASATSQSTPPPASRELAPGGCAVAVASTFVSRRAGACELWGTSGSRAAPASWQSALQPTSKTAPVRCSRSLDLLSDTQQRQ